MLHSDSEEEESEEEQKKKVQVNKQGLYLEHGYYVKNKKKEAKASAQPNTG